MLTYLLMTKNLILLNDTEAPATYIGEVNRECKTNPDVTICTQDLSEDIVSWFVDTVEDSQSDHRYIHFSMSLLPKLVNRNRYKTKYTNLKKFNSKFKLHAPQLQEDLNKVNTKLTLDEWLQKFNSVITDICQSSLKTKKLKLYPELDWWRVSLKAQRNKISALRKKYKITGDPKWRAILHSERALYKKQN